MKNLDKESFNKFIQTHQVLVQFSADWCGPCKILSNTLKGIVPDISVDIAKLDVDKSIDIATKYSIRSVPILIFFENGQEKARSIGAKNKDAILKFINTNL